MRESEADYHVLEDGPEDVRVGSGSFEDDGTVQGNGSFDDDGTVDEVAATKEAASPVRAEVVAFVRLAWPVALTCVLELLPSLASIVIVGRFCDRNALDGAALGTMYYNVAGLSIGLGLTTAMDTLAPQAVGAGKPKLLGIYVQRGGLVLGCALVPLCLMAVFATEILEGVGQPRAVSIRAGSYVRWMLPSLPCMWAFELVRKVLHAFGRVEPLAYIGAMSTALHVVLAYFMVATNVFGYKFGFVGAALARSVSVIAALAALCLYSKCSGLSKLWWSGLAPLRVVARDVGQFLQLGGAGCAAICLEWWAFEFLAIFAGLLPKRPDVYIGAHAVLFNLAALMYMLLSGCASAASVRTGLALGAGRPGGAKLASRVGLAFALAAGATNAIIIYTARHKLPALFATDSGIRRCVAVTMPALALYQIFDAFNAVTGGIMRGAGRQATPAIIMLFAYYVFGIPCALLFSFTALDMRLTGLWLGLTVGLVVSSILLATSLGNFDWHALAKEALQLATLQAERTRSQSVDDRHPDDNDDDDAASARASTVSGLSLPHRPDDPAGLVGTNNDDTAIV